MNEIVDIRLAAFPCDKPCEFRDFQVQVEGRDEEEVRRQCERRRAELRDNPLMVMLSDKVVSETCMVMPTRDADTEGVPNV